MFGSFTGNVQTNPQTESRLMAAGAGRKGVAASAQGSSSEVMKMC